MLPIKPPIFRDDLSNSSHKQNHIVKKYDSMYPNYRPQYNYDLRLIICRHAERIDQSLGQDWYDKVFNGVPSAPTIAYRHSALPYRLPVRSNTLLYVFDPPISRTGEQQAYVKGQELLRTGATVDYCYSSPASRCVLTANAILRGMNRSHVPLRLEPSLFEPMNWNSALLLLDKMPPFMSTSDWRQSGYNVDQRYKRFHNHLNPHETETDYYNRSREYFDSLVRHHGKPMAGYSYRPIQKRRTILLVGHASSSEIFSTIALRQPFDVKIFGEQAAKVPYLHTAVLERDANTHRWHLRSALYYR